MMKRILPLFLLLALVLNACNIPVVSAPTATSPVVTQIPVSTPVISYGAIARDYVKTLTDMGPRVAGTDQEAQAAEAIADVFAGFGYPTETQPFTETDDNGGTIDSANVVAVKSGKSAQEIIVGAHYDSADVGLGADDNASGVAVMLEAAELVKNVPTPYTIRFIAFGAEEAGLLGSYAYLNQMSQAEFENTIAMINLDSLAAGDITYVYSDEGQQAALRDWMLEWAFGNGLDLQTIHNVDLSEDDGGGVSDYAAFRDAGIPFVYFEATNWTLGDQDGYTQVDPQYGDKGKIWHTGDDTLEYLDTHFPGRVDQHLDLFVTVLFNILTQYEGSVQ
jgi:alkaline phosphatase isozyme conversion protein